MFTISIAISCGSDRVFSYLQDVERAPSWYSAVTKVWPVDGDTETAIGKRFLFERRLGGRTVTNEVEVTELEPGRALTITSVQGPTPFVYRYSLAADGEGTLLTLEGDISGKGLPGALALAAPLASSMFERGMRANLATFKRLVEAGP